MYHEVGIAKLSPTQISRLRNGHKVRVKMGNAHKINVSQEQLKKLNSAHKKGKAYTILFDPFQIEKHGAGIYGNISTKSKAKGKGVVSDVLHTAGNVSKSVGLGVARKHTTTPKRRSVRKGKGLLGCTDWRAELGIHRTQAGRIGSSRVTDGGPRPAALRPRLRPTPSPPPPTRPPRGRAVPPECTAWCRPG